MLVMLSFLYLQPSYGFDWPEYKDMNGKVEVKYENDTNLTDKIYFKVIFTTSIPEELLAYWDKIASRITVFHPMVQGDSPTIHFDELNCSKSKKSGYVLCVNEKEGWDPNDSSYDIFTNDGINPAFQEATISLRLKFEKTGGTEINYTAGTDLKDAVPYDDDSQENQDEGKPSAFSDAFDDSGGDESGGSGSQSGSTSPSGGGGGQGEPAGTQGGGQPAQGKVLDGSERPPACSMMESSAYSHVALAFAGFFMLIFAGAYLPARMLARRMK